MLTAPEVAAELDRRAHRIADAACSMTSPDKDRNEPFTAETREGVNRVRSLVFTSSVHGIRANNRHSTLIKSLKAGQ